MQIDNTYLIASFKDRVLFLDQHAAHEKILYAQIMEQLQEGKMLEQVMLESCELESSEIVVEEIKDFLAENSGDIHLAASTLACKSAVRAGDYLDPEERVRLIKKLLETNLEQYTCPHGRPT
ncbi:MAG TPA: hypothetical protein ENN92_01765, partial [candidate division WWE3 bacterium]|nr:hypothetical protein [candidate division WWE3 bacterium]